jgi:hypothetical protein
VRFEIVCIECVLWMSFDPKAERIPVTSETVPFFFCVCVQNCNICDFPSAERDRLDMTLGRAQNLILTVCWTLNLEWVGVLSI